MRLSSACIGAWPAVLVSAAAAQPTHYDLKARVVPSDNALSGPVSCDSVAFTFRSLTMASRMKLAPAQWMNQVQASRAQLGEPSYSTRSLHGPCSGRNPSRTGSTHW